MTTRQDHAIRRAERLTRNRLWMPGLCLLLGALLFGAYAVGDEPGEGAQAFLVMAVLSGVFLFARRSETLQGLGGPGRDERWASIDVRATAFAGMATIAAVFGGFLYEIADGRDGSPYGLLATVAGVAYLLAVAVLRQRS